MTTATALRRRRTAKIIAEKPELGSRERPHEIDPLPNPVNEKVVHYYEELPGLYRRIWGQEPSRTSMTNWLATGYPIKRGGPYVAMPTWIVLRRPMTTRQALNRWVTLVRDLESQR